MKAILPVWMFTQVIFVVIALTACASLRNPFFLDSESGFEWTLNPVFSGQCFLQVLPAV